MLFDTIIVDMVQGVAASAGAGAIGSVGWLASKLWSAYRHEIRDMKQTMTSSVANFTSCVEHFQDHMRRDEEVQTALLGELREIRGYIKGQTDQPLVS